MGWNPGPRPAWVQDVIDGRAGPLLDDAAEPFDAGTLLAEAAVATGLGGWDRGTAALPTAVDAAAVSASASAADVGAAVGADLGEVAGGDAGAAVRPTPLEVLLRSAEDEADLHVVGRYRFREMMLRLLRNRLTLVDYTRRDPGVRAETVAAPLVVTGSPRSGTSLLHSLLAQDPALRAPLAWEFFSPTPPPAATGNAEPPEDRVRIATAERELRLSARLAPAFDGMHEMSARTTRECVAAQDYSLTSDDMWGLYTLPSYSDYLATVDWGPAYDWHRLVLQVLQRRARGPTRWALKAPSHLQALDAVVATYPDAALVVIHRDPLTMLSSVCSLLATLHWAHSATVDFGALVAAELERHGRLLDRLVDWREANPDVPVQDVDYRRFAADPLGALVDVYAGSGTPMSAAARAAMADYLAAHPQGRHGGHRHSFDTLGLDYGAVRARFARYQRRFGVADDM